jgi:hypothetical protein
MARKEKMNNQAKGFSMDVPYGWTEAIIRSIIVALVGFIVLQVKEFIDAGTLDTIGTGTDALLIAGAYLFVNAGLMAFAKPKSEQGRMTRLSK